jgi:hypothetical protein
LASDFRPAQSCQRAGRRSRIATPTSTVGRRAEPAGKRREKPPRRPTVPPPITASRGTPPEIEGSADWPLTNSTEA